MSKQLDIFIESLGTLLSPFVIDYNFILCKNIYKNTVDGYSGNWGCSTSSNPTYAIIIDLMRKDISPVEELGYMIKPLYYYMEKQCST